MIVTRLQGRLGNQLFQYALGRHLAHHHKVPFFLDAQFINCHPLASYQLSPFCILEQLLSHKDLEKLLRKRFLFRRPKLTRVEQKSRLFDPSVLTLPKSVYLDGLWMSEKFFKPIESIIRKEFQIRAPQEGKNLELAQEVFECNSVSLHIRRGDYVSDKVTNVKHGLCSKEYYQHAAEEIAKATEAPHFYVFTDDPEWAKSSFKLPYPTKVIDHNGAEHSHEDLRLMSQCKHHIIANSTFSWWGAYLNPDPNKLVFAPRLWFADEKANAETVDFLPETWIRI